MSSSISLDNDKSDNASHVYRGYRKQIFFILHQILSGDKSRIFCPEGIEDFSTMFNDKVESIYQVKDHNSPLVLSDISSEKTNSLTKRIVGYMQKYPDANVILAYYGTLGPELQKISDKDSITLNNCAIKVSRYDKIPIDDAAIILQKIKFQQLSEEIILRDINSLLSSTNLGLDTDNSRDLLFWWLFQQSESRNKITQESLIGKIQNIGKFVRDKSLHHEWMGSIIPIHSLITSNINKYKLQETYLQGISATFNHIFMNLDVARISKLDLIRDKFRASNVVIIKGASGQGKTSLAFRYIKDNFPMELSYQIKEPESRSHAFSIIESIIEHHRAFDVPVYLYYDINITDTQWPYIIEKLSNLPNIFLLVTIRSEDWKRNNTFIREKITLEEIDLDFSLEEAKYLFNMIPQSYYINFNDSWLDFGEKGPLLEYVYLLQNGSKLKDRLSTQIDRIKKEANESGNTTELNLLRIITIANSYGAKLKISKIRILKSLPSPESVIDKFDREYLIKFSSINGIIEGFHPVRSQILCSLLFDDIFHPWINTFPAAFEAIPEDDIETFLLYAFYHQKDEVIESILETLLNFSSREWIGYCGILKSLLWLGIKRYADENRALIDKLKEEKPNVDFRLVLDVDIGNATNNLVKTLKDSFNILAPDLIPVIEHYQEKQTDKTNVFKYAKNWMMGQKAKPEILSTQYQFLALSELMFWYGFLNIETSLFEGISNVIDKCFDDLEFHTISELILSSSFIHCPNLTLVLKKHSDCIFNTFTDTYGILFTEEYSNTIKAHYILEIDDADKNFIISDKLNNNAKSMAIIDTMQKIFTGKEYYSTQGHGSDILSSVFGIDCSDRHDDTFKNISKSKLPLRSLVHLNSTFIGYIQYKYRLQTWETYIAQILSVRENLISLFQKIIYGLNKYYKRKDLSVIIDKETIPLLIKVSNDLKNIPLLPKCTVDIWGFTNEGNSEVIIEGEKGIGNNYIVPEKIISLQRYYKFQKSCSDIFFSCSNFIDQATSLVVKRKNSAIEDNYLSLHNLIDAYNQLNTFQTEFRSVFIDYCKNSLGLLEKKEKKTFSQISALWYFFCFYPNKYIDDAIKYCDSFIRVIFNKEIKSFLLQNLENNIFSYRIQERLIEDKNTLWIIGDIQKTTTLSDEDYEQFTRHFSGDFFRGVFNKYIDDLEPKRAPYLLTYHWNYIYIVFTYKNKLIFQSTKRAYILSLLSASTSHFLDFPIDSSFPLQELGINGTWSNIQKDTAESFIENYLQLRILLNHTVELLTTIEDNKSKSTNFRMNEKMVTGYISSQLIKSEHYFQGIIDAIKTTIELLKNRASEDNNINVFIQYIVDNYKNYFPDPNQDTNGSFSCIINSDMLSIWKKRIDENYPQVMNYCYMLIMDSLR